MIIKCYNENHPYLLFIDIEFDNTHLIQFAGLLFKRIDTDGTYQLQTSINQYVSAKVGYPFMEYTGINNSFLDENGIPLSSLRTLIFDDVLGEIPMKDIMVISHGLRNDRLVLSRNGINLSQYADENGAWKPIDGYCTFNNAKRILNRNDHVGAADLANQFGYYLHNAHNAYNDVWSEVVIFTALKKIEEQEKGEEGEN